jgi:hypothetical protein
MNSMHVIRRIVLGVIAALSPVLSAAAAVQPFPPAFRTQEIKTDGATIHVRVGGKGPAVVLLHAFGDTGDVGAGRGGVGSEECADAGIAHIAPFLK